jgi:hypothetical protein
MPFVRIDHVPINDEFQIEDPGTLVHHIADEV